MERTNVPYEQGQRRRRQERFWRRPWTAWEGPGTRWGNWPYRGSGSSSRSIWSSRSNPPAPAAPTLLRRASCRNLWISAGHFSDEPLLKHHCFRKKEKRKRQKVKELTIFLWGMVSKRRRSWKSGLIRSYGSLPCTKLQIKKPNKNQHVTFSKQRIDF